jgi:hypothetical protein
MENVDSAVPHKPMRMTGLRPMRSDKCDYCPSVTDVVGKRDDATDPVKHSQCLRNEEKLMLGENVFLSSRLIEMICRRG